MDKKKVYVDSAATSFPKPDAVPRAVFDYMTKFGSNVNRGGYNSAYDTEAVVFETRELLASLFHAPDYKNVIFTKNITESLNFVLKGLLHEGDHVLCSSKEHNADAASCAIGRERRFLHQSALCGGRESFC